MKSVHSVPNLCHGNRLPASQTVGNLWHMMAIISLLSFALLLFALSHPPPDWVKGGMLLAGGVGIAFDVLTHLLR